MTETRKVVDVIHIAFVSGRISCRKNKFVTDNIKDNIYAI